MDPIAETAPSDIADLLIERAAEMLAEQGLDSLSIRKVASAAGTSTMAVYTHFGSKADLVRAVVDRGFALLATELAAVATTDDPVADLVELGRAYRAMALGNAHLYRVMFSRNPLDFGDPSSAVGAEVGEAVGLDAFGHLVSATRRIRTATIERADAHGDPEGDDADALALGLWGLVHGCVDLELAGFLDDGATAITRALSALLDPPGT